MWMISVGVPVLFLSELSVPVKLRDPKGGGCAHRRGHGAGQVPGRKMAVSWQFPGRALAGLGMLLAGSGQSKWQEVAVLAPQ
jgi:hypothetical protein